MMSAVQFGIFEEFKGGTTLLIWGDGPGMGALGTLLRRLAGGNITTAQLGRLPWARAVRDTELELSVVAPGCEGEEVRQLGDRLLVTWKGTIEQFQEGADLVEALEQDSCDAGHQYMPTRSAQFIVSKGEYPSDFPDRTYKSSRD